MIRSYYCKQRSLRREIFFENPIKAYCQTFLVFARYCWINLILLVTPGEVIVTGFFKANTQNCSSRRVQWQPLDTGCVVEYNIEFLDINGVTLDVETIMDNRTFFCTDRFDNASSVIMWATFKNETGNKSSVVSLQTTTTTTTTTTNTVTTPSEGNKYSS